MIYEEKIACFENSCHLYKKEIEEVERLRNGTLDPLQQRRLALMEADVKFVNDTFDKIKDECGRHARLLMWSIFIEEKKGDDVADQFGISRATLSNWIKIWRKKIFGGG